MDESEKQALRDLKAQTVQELQSLPIDFRLCSSVDDRLTLYIKACIERPEAHNLYELLAIKKFHIMTCRYELRALEVQKFILTYEFLEFPSDEGAKRYKLTPIQVFQFTNIEGFFYPGTERKVITDALLFVPRKFSKTTSVASLAVKDLLFGDANAQAFVVANSSKQAKICFDVIRFILKRLDHKMRRFKINREQVFNLCRGKSSFAQCLASDVGTLDGLNASTVIVDEYAQADSAALKNVLTSSMGVRLNPLTVIITTASSKTETPFYEMLKTYKSVLRGEIEMDSVFAHIFEPDVDDDEGDPATWYKVQPHLGVTCREEFYKDKWDKAQLCAEDMQEFRNKLLNIFAHSELEDWIPTKEIESRSIRTDIESFRGVRCVASVDLSVCDDLSAVSYLLYMPGRVLPERTTETPFHSITHYYFPEGQIATHPNGELYQRWVDAGYLTLCEGAVIDYRQIVNDILSKPFSILGVGYDRYKAEEFIRLLKSSPGVGKEHLYEIAQTYGNFTSPVESFELSLYTNRITFEDNPITAYCFGNATIDEDRLENRKPIKKKQSGKIDGAITNVMNFWMLNNIKMTQ